jgi:hypothetical protein
VTYGYSFADTVQVMARRIVWLELHRQLSQYRLDQLEGELLVLRYRMKLEALRAAAAAAQAPEFHNIAGTAG